MEDQLNKFWIYFSTVGSAVTGYFTYTHTCNYFQIKNLKEISVKDLATSKNLSSPICVSGSISTHNMFDSQTCKEDLKVVYSNYTDSRYPQFSWTNYPIYKINKNSTKEFSLKEGKYEIFIQPTDETDINAIEAYNKAGYNPMSLWAAIKSFISSLFFWAGALRFWRVDVYQSITEEVIPKDSDICAIGEIKKISNKLTIIPDFIGYSKSIFLNKKKHELYWLYGLQFFLGMIMIGSLSYMFKRRNIRRMREERDRENMIRSPPGFQCIVCGNNPRNVIIEPCKHLNTCLDCCQNLNECPTCRAPINQRNRIYFT